MSYERKEIVYPIETVNILREKIAQTGLDWKELDQVLIKTQGGIAGSAVLQAELKRRNDPRIHDPLLELKLKAQQRVLNKEKWAIGEKSERLQKEGEGISEAEGKRYDELQEQVEELQRQINDLSEDQWADSDIDFWVQQNTKEYLDPTQFLHPLFIKSGYELSSKVSPKCTGYQRLMDYVKVIYIYRKRRSEEITGGGSKTVEAIPLQVMVLNKTKCIRNEDGSVGAREEITFASAIQSFDISVCQMGYDGKRVFGFYPIGDTFVLTPAGRAQSKFEWIRTLYRCVKYSQRGFEGDYFDIINAAVKSWYATYQKEAPQLFAKAKQNKYVLTFARYQLTSFIAALNKITNTAAKENTVKKLFKLSIDDKMLVSISKEDGQNLVKYNFGPFLIPPLKTRVQNVIMRQLQSIFSLPADFVASAPQETKVSESVESSIQGGTCFDFIAYDDEQIESYLNENRHDNIVILDTRGQNGVCFTRSQIAEGLEDSTGVYFPCLRAESMGSAAGNLVLARMTMKDFTAFVPIQDLEAITSSVVVVNEENAHTDWVFELKPGNFTVPYSASVELFVSANPNYVSADHCQEGTQKTVYRLVPVHLTRSTAIQGSGADKKHRHAKKKLSIIAPRINPLLPRINTRASAKAAKKIKK